MAKQMKCECGCGGSGYYNQMVTIKVEEAIDETLRQTQTQRSFLVLYRCKEAFTEELQLMTLLQIAVKAHAPKPKTFLQKLNVWQTFRDWRARTKEAVRVMRLQHAIHERNWGFEYSRQRAKKSAILFAAPRFLVPILAKRWKGSLSRPEPAGAIAQREAQERRNAEAEAEAEANQ